MPQKYKALIGGKWIEGKEFIEVTHKYTNEVIGLVPVANRETFERAIKSAQDGFSLISNMPAYQRSEILQKTSESLEKNKDEITRIIAMEAGKAWKHAKAEVERGVCTFKLASEGTKSIHGETVPMDAISG